MGKYQRNKGGRGEREIVNLLKSHDIPAKRISPLETNHEDKGDILVAECWKAEVKVGDQIPKFIYEAMKEGEDMLFCKRDRKEWLVVMPVDKFIERFL